MSSEFWGMLAIGVAVVGFNWRMVNSLRQEVNGRLDALQADVASIKERLSHIEGWIQGRFREGTAHE